MFFFFIYLKMNLEVYCNNYVCLFVKLSFFRVYVKIYVGVFKLMKLLKKNYRYLFMLWVEYLYMKSYNFFKNCDYDWIGIKYL